MNKFLMLDVDGVLNTCYVNSPNDFELDKLDLLRKVVRETGCLIVLSSTWRINNKNFRRVENALAQFGMTIFSSTPVTMRPRKEEIAEWLSVNPSFSRIAIIDDDTDAELFGENIQYFETQYDTGLTKEIANRMIGFLNETT